MCGYVMRIDFFSSMSSTQDFRQDYRCQYDHEEYYRDIELLQEILELKGLRLDAVWNKNKSNQNSEASDGDILTEILPKFLNLVDTKHWNGTISDLHEALFNRFSPDQQPWKVKWPKTAMGLSKRLTMLTSALNSVGVTFVRERGSGKRILSLKLDTVE